MGLKAKPLEERFWRHVTPLITDACWEWRGTKTQSGYGQLSYPPQNFIGAHRVSYGIKLGVDPRELGPLDVCHTCDNPGCVNPNHLFEGTRQANVTDMWNKDRGKYPFKTHCQRGHELQLTGIYVSKDGKHRRCRQCHIDRQISWESKQKMERAV